MATKKAKGTASTKARAGSGSSSRPLVNNQAQPAVKGGAARDVTAAAPPCWVSQTAFGAPITQVKQSTTTSNNLYWMNFSSSNRLFTLDFIVTFKPGSPLVNQHQRFSFPAGYAGGTGTPFGVPFWGGNPILGPAVLTVLANGLPAGTYNFTVIA